MALMITVNKSHHKSNVGAVLTHLFFIKIVNMYVVEGSLIISSILYGNQASIKHLNFQHVSCLDLHIHDPFKSTREETGLAKVQFANFVNLILSFPFQHLPK